MPTGRKRVCKVKLEVAMLVGAESKAFLQDLTEQLDRMEKLAAQIKGAPVKAAAPVETEDEEVDETPAPKAKRGRPAKVKAAVVDDDDDFEEEDEENEEEEVDDEEADDEETEDEEEAPAPVKAKAKAKKITIDDVNDACKAFARENGGGKAGRDAALKILKKHFKVTSLSEIAPENYAKIIQLMAV